MKIGVDARPLQHETQYRGIGKSLESLLAALPVFLRPDDSLVFYVDAGLPMPRLPDKFSGSQVIKMPTARLGRKRYWRSFLNSFKPINPRRGEVDVLLQYDAAFGVPRSVPSVVVFHDLITYLFRGQEKQRPVKGLRKGKDMLARNLYWKKYLRVINSYRRAAKIIAISNSSMQDLLKYVKGIKAADVEVISHGVSASLPSGKPSPNAIKLAGRPYLMYAGGIDIRKNITGLLETFYKLKPEFPKLRLIMIGKEFELKDQLGDLGWFDILNSNQAYAKDVIIPGFVSGEDLHYLYSNAQAFVFPSRYEGFGLPVLEAMASGCPVVAYNNSSIPEVAGDAALLVRDGQPLAPAIKKLLNDTKLRRQLISRGNQRIKDFPWSASAEKTLKLLRRAAAKIYPW
jgi:glycosyltransferase involved in cell wall biosynthesis